MTKEWIEVRRAGLNPYVVILQLFDGEKTVNQYIIYAYLVDEEKKRVWFWETPFTYKKGKNEVHFKHLGELNDFLTSRGLPNIYIL
ncbi:hypothetical protein [Muninn virus]|nr:hypothetical protein [Muninn virus]